jgi:hypothetical protein
LQENGVISRKKPTPAVPGARKRRVAATLWLSTAGLLSVNACADRTPEPTVRAPPPPLETVVAAASAPTVPPPPRPARKPAPPTQASLETAAPAAEAASPAPTAPVNAEPMVAPQAAPTAPPATDAVTQLTGRNQASVATLLGEPQGRDEAAPATIWRYVARDCELDVYFYLDLNAKELRALHYEVKGNDASDRPQQCYAQLVADRRARIDTAGGADRPR